MVLQLFVCLLTIAAASLLITQGRRRRIWSVLIFAGLSIMAYLFMNTLSGVQGGSFIYQWLPYDTLKADISISSSLRMRQMFMPLICLLAGLVYLNTIFASERHSLHFNILMLLNFVSLILLASSHDFLQLLFAGSMLSVISFYMPDLILPKKKIFIFNFLAEMAVFMALAIVYSRTKSVSLVSLSEYAADGRHKDLTAFLLLFAIGIKCGLFLLNGQYYNLKDIAFNRIIGIMALSVPLSGLFLADKLRPLLEASDLAEAGLPVWCTLSVIIGLISSLINNNLKSKVISLSLAIYGLALFLVWKDARLLQTLALDVLILNTFVLAAFLFVSQAASEESDVSRLGGFIRYTKGNFALTCLIMMLVASGLSSWSDNSLVFKFVVAYLTVLAANFRIIYWGRTRADEKVLAFARSAGVLYSVPLAGICIWLLWQQQIWRNMAAYEFFGWSAAVFLLCPVLWIVNLGNREILKADILSTVYERLVIRPLKFCGRILWLVFDVVVIERSVIATLSAAASMVVSAMQKAQEARIKNYILSILGGLSIMLLYWGFYVYE